MTLSLDLKKKKKNNSAPTSLLSLPQTRPDPLAALRRTPSVPTSANRPNNRRTAPIVAGLFERMRQQQNQQRQQNEAQNQQPAGSSFVAAAAPPPPPPQPVPAPTGPPAPDYSAAATDCTVLRLPPKTELTPEEITHVFGYRRDFTEAYEMGEVLGAGSFGVVRACRRRDGKGPAAAVKTIAKVPRRGPATPRHLLKLRSEADVMRQLGPSLDAVSLFETFEDDACLHLVTVRSFVMERGSEKREARKRKKKKERKEKKLTLFFLQKKNFEINKQELCAGGSVLEAARTGSLSEARVADVARSILRFLAQCHAKGIVFRDVKVRKRKRKKRRRERERRKRFQLFRFFLVLLLSAFSPFELFSSDSPLPSHLLLFPSLSL